MWDGVQRVRECTIFHFDDSTNGLNWYDICPQTSLLLIYVYFCWFRTINVVGLFFLERTQMSVYCFCGDLLIFVGFCCFGTVAKQKTTKMLIFVDFCWFMFWTKKKMWMVAERNIMLRHFFVDAYFPQDICWFMLFNVENQHKLVFYVGLCGFLLIFVCQPSIVYE